MKKKVTKVVDRSDGKSILRIRISAYDHMVVDQAVKQILETAEQSGAVVIGPIPLPTKLKKITINRPTFKSGSSKEQYEMRIHKRLIDIVEPSEVTIGNLTNMDLPAGVGVEIEM